MATYEKYCILPQVTGFKPKVKGQSDRFQNPKVIIGSTIPHRIVVFPKTMHVRCLEQSKFCRPHIAPLHPLYLKQVNYFLEKLTDKIYHFHRDGNQLEERIRVHQTSIVVKPRGFYKFS